MFGTIFSKSGMSADPKKTKAIKEAGPPQNADEVKSFLQACQFNASFMYNTDKAYAQITKPLRDLTKKNTKFLWTAHCQQAYKEILQTMTSNTALRGCLYESRDGTFVGTGRYPGSRHVYVPIIFITFRLYEAGTFFVPSRLGGISLSATGIPAEAGRFSSYKRFIPGDRDEIMLTCNIEIRNTAGNSRNGGHIT